MGYKVKINGVYISSIEGTQYTLGNTPYVFEDEEEAKLWARYIHGHVYRFQ